MSLSQRQKGIILMLLATGCFSAMQIAIKFSSRLPVMEQVFFRNSISLIVAFVILKKEKLSIFGEKRYQPYLFGRSIFGFLSLITLFYASARANQADVAILSKLSPFMITIIAAVFLHEKITPVQIPAIIIALIGAAFVSKPSFTDFNLPLMAAFVSAIFSAGAYTLLSFFKGKVHALTVVMHFSTFSTVASLPFMLKDFVMPDFKEWLLLILIGIFGSFGQIFITYSYRFAKATEISIYNYSGIIYSALFGFIFLSEQLSLSTLIGGGLVILSAFMVYTYNNKLEAEK